MDAFTRADGSNGNRFFLKTVTNWEGLGRNRCASDGENKIKIVERGPNYGGRGERGGRRRKGKSETM